MGSPSRGHRPPRASPGACLALLLATSPAAVRADPAARDVPRRVGPSVFAGAGAIVGAEGPAFVADGAPDGRWFVIRQARVDTNHDGRLDYAFSCLGTSGGDELRPWFVSGSGAGEALEGYWGRDPSGRYAACSQAGRLWLRASRWFFDRAVSRVLWLDGGVTREVEGLVDVLGDRAIVRRDDGALGEVAADGSYTERVPAACKGALLDVDGAREELVVGCAAGVYAATPTVVRLGRAGPREVREVTWAWGAWPRPTVAAQRRTLPAGFAFAELEHRPYSLPQGPLRIVRQRTTTPRPLRALTTPR